MSSSTATTVQTEPWVVLYAVRYGLGRGTGAYVDVLRLIEDNAEVLKHWQASVVRDIKDSITRPHPFRGKDETDKAEALLERLATVGWDV